MEPCRYFVLNKPPKTICARRDFAGRSTVYDHVPRWYPDLPHVGRLDWATEGLLLFTDDGKLAQGLLNPTYKGSADAAEVPPIEKVYRVKVRDRLDPKDPRIARLELPLDYPGGIVTRPAKASEESGDAGGEAPAAEASAEGAPAAEGAEGAKEEGSSNSEGAKDETTSVVTGEGSSS